MKKTFTPSLLAAKGDKRYLKGRQRRLAEMDSWADTPAHGTKWIPLLNGKRAVVDEEDFELLNQWNWYLRKPGYVVSQIDGIKVYMHRVILTAQKGVLIDHINHQPTDNRKVNLRVCTFQENHRNRLKTTGKTSRFKGVSKHASGIGWVVEITVGKNQRYRRYLKTEEAAALRYNEQAKIHFGEFAALNDI